MGMGGGGGKGGAMSEINVTPMIDVLLVLLIIFMVIVPTAPHGLNTLVPQPPKNKDNTPDQDKVIVVQVLKEGGTEPTYKINEDQFPKAQLEPKLVEIFSTRNNKTMFVKGDADLDYGKIAEVIDMGHQANVDNIGLITPKIQAGQ